MSIADKLTLLAASKEIVRLKLGISEDVPFSEYGDHIGWDGITSDLGQSTTTAASQKLVTDREALLQTSIAAILGINKKLTNRINALEESNISSLFNNGASNGIWLDPSDLKTMYQNVGGASLPVTKDGDPVGLMLDKSQGLEGAVTNVAKPFKADSSNDQLEVTNTSDGTKLVIKTLSNSSSLHIFEEGKTYNLSVVYSIPETASSISAHNTSSGASNFLFTATKGVRNKAEVTLTAKSTALFFRTYSGEITIHEVVLKEIKGNHASQPLAASRPTYRTDGILHWLEGDGVDDSIYTSNFGLAQPSTIALGASILTAKLAYLFDGLGDTSGYVLLNALGQNRTLAGLGSIDYFDPKIPVGQKFVTSVTFNAEKSEIAFNGEAARLFSTSSKAMQGISLFSRLADQTAFKTHGRIYGVVVLNGLVDPLKKNQIARYLASKSGVEI